MKPTLIVVALAIVLCFADNFSPVPPLEPHQCKWKLCPYKGVEEKDFDAAVKKYSDCEEGTDCYIIDFLHLHNPTLEYEDLEKMLFDNH